LLTQSTTLARDHTRIDACRSWRMAIQTLNAREPCGAGGLKALVGDAEEVRKAVEFGTACGAFVTKARKTLKSETVI